MIAHSLPLSYLVSAIRNVQHCLRHERIVSGPQFNDVRLHDFVLQSQEHVFMSKTLLKRRNFNVSLKILPYLGFLPTWKKLVMLQDFSRVVVRTYVCILRIINRHDLCKSGCILICTELLQLVNLGMTWPFKYEGHTFLTRMLIFIVNPTLQDLSF